MLDASSRAGFNGRGLHLCVRERARRTHPLSGTVAFDKALNTVEQKAPTSTAG